MTICPLLDSFTVAAIMILIPVRRSVRTLIMVEAMPDDKHNDPLVRRGCPRSSLINYRDMAEAALITEAK